MRSEKSPLSGPKGGGNDGTLGGRETVPFPGRLLFDRGRPGTAGIRIVTDARDRSTEKVYVPPLSDAP